MTPAERGVLYVATGAAHLGAARASAASVRRTNPRLSVAVFTDIPDPGPVFDIVLPVENAHYRSKVDCMHQSPFAETLYLDSDTRVFGDLAAVFRLAERFDMALAYVARYWARGYQRQWRCTLPETFPQLNTGVMLFRDTVAVRELLADWTTAYYASGAPGDDQLAFRELIWESDLRVAVLPATYNARRYSWADRILSHRPPPVILHANRYHPVKCGGPLRRRLAALASPRLE